MRIILTSLFLLKVLICLCQVNTRYRSDIENPELDKRVNAFEIQNIPNELDSLYEIRNSINDGEITLFWSHNKAIPNFKFSVKNGNVNGPFYCWNRYGILTTVGNYSNDSIWSFRKGYFMLSDTTFKSGTWRYYALSNPKDSLYYYAHITERSYKIFYDKNNTYIEKWNFRDGQIWEERIFEKWKGLVVNKIFNENGTRYLYYELTQNSSIEMYWDDNGNTLYISIDNKTRYKITTQNGKGFYNYKIKDEEKNNKNGESLNSKLYYPNGNLMEFYDEKTGIRILFDENGKPIKLKKGKGLKVREIK